MSGKPSGLSWGRGADPGADSQANPFIKLSGSSKFLPQLPGTWVRQGLLKGQASLDEGLPFGMLL